MTTKSEYTFYGLSVYVASEDFGCSGTRKSYITFLFKDGTTLNLSDDESDIDCSDYSSSLYSLTESDLNKLSNKTLTKIRFSQSEGYADFEVSGTYSIKELISVVK